MHAIELVFAIGWAAFWIYWLVAAFSMKRGRVPWSRELRIRAVIVIGAILLLRLGAFRDDGLNSDPWRAGLGLFLFALGLGFAIWARVHIGRNWGTPMSQKDEPELVTSGPYRLMGLDRLARGKLVSEPPAGSTDSARAMSPMARSCPVGLVRRQTAGGMSCLEH